MAEIKFNPHPPLGHPSACRAFIPHTPRGFDFSDLTRFASVRKVIWQDSALFPDKAAEVEGTLVNLLWSALNAYHFDSLRDYVVLVGDPIINAAVMYALGRKERVDSVTLLRFDGISRVYWPFTL